MRTFITPDYRNNTAVYPKLCYSTVLGIENQRNFTIGPRSIDDYIVIYVTNGVFFCRQYGRHFQLEKGEYILLDLHDIHSYYFDPQVPSEIYWMHINGEQTARIFDILRSITTLPIIGHDAKILEYLKTAIAIQKQSSADVFGYSVHISNTLMHILSSVYKQKINKEQSDEEYEFCTNFETVINNLSMSELSLSVISRHMHISKFYFAHMFKKIYNTTPMKYILVKRLEKAKKLLECTNIKIAAISDECGFSSADYFSTVFRREYGVSPNEYRKKFFTEI